MKFSTIAGMSLLMLASIPLAAAADAFRLNKNNFHEYITAFEKMDVESLGTKFYSKDIAVAIGTTTLDLKGLLEMEKASASLQDFKVEILQLVADNTGIALDGYENVNILQTGENALIGAVTKGDKWQLHINVFYKLAKGKIVDIRANVVSAKKVEHF
jgi:predicted ester cyclase